jgi:two-component system, NarL family, sensor histidine kinase DevS
MGVEHQAQRVRRLLDVGRTLTRELDQRVVLDRVPQMARELTGASYAALAVMNEQGTGLEHFLTAGVDEQTRRAIGHPPRGRGVLGDLILDPHPLRLADVRQHPSSYAFPDGHPVMRSFLGVPIMIRGYACGSLHLAEKAEGEFTDADEQAIVALAKDAADTIRFERRFQGKEAAK